MKSNFLDISLDLSSDSYSPFRKPNSGILYIHNKSNHPAHVKKSIPSMITKRLCTLSKTAKEFDNCKADYENALRRSGFNTKLKFEEPKKEKGKRKRKRECLFYNPPFCQSVRKNIGRAFLKLVDKYFTKSHKYRSIFNRSTLKISYSCMANIKTIIQSHNQKILSEKTQLREENKKKCNCKNKKGCPLDGECIVNNVIYEATVTTNDTVRSYVGSTGCQFKKRWYKHRSDFSNRKQRLSTELPKHIWNLKEDQTEFSLK